MSDTLDLYSILGIARDATEKQIQKAYHALSMQVHPDRGGNKEAFKPISLAYEVLSDPKRRERYDKTGSTDTADPSLALVCQFLTQVLLEALNVGRDLERVDVIAGIENLIGEASVRITAMLKENRKRANIMKQAAERFSTKGPENLFRKVALEPVADLERQVRLQEEELEHLARALEIAEQYKYKFRKGGKEAGAFTFGPGKFMGISNGKFVTFGE